MTYRSVRFLILFLLISGVAVAWLSTVSSALKYPVSNDGAGYVEEATNLLAGRGLTRTPWHLRPFDTDAVSSGTFPPGYSVAIAGLSRLGLSPVDAGILIARAAWILLLVAVVFSLSPLIGFPLAGLCALITATSPAVYEHGFGVYSDVPNGLLIAVSFGLLIRSFAGSAKEAHAVLPLLMAGLFASAAYAVRNAGLAYYLAVYSALAAAPVLRVFPLRCALRATFYFTLGTLPVVSLLFWRNYVAFADVQPYPVVRGEFAPFIVSVRVFLEAVFLDLSGSKMLARLAWDAKFLVLVGVPVIMLITFGLWKRWPLASPAVRFAILLAGLFSFATASMLVIAHTFSGLDPGNLLRHVIPITWLLVALMVITAAGSGTWSRRTAAVAAAGLALLAGHLVYIGKDLYHAREVRNALAVDADIARAVQPLTAEHGILTKQIKYRLAEDPDVLEAVRNIPDNALVFANLGSFLKHLTGRPVRNIEHARDFKDLFAKLDRLALEVNGLRPIYVAIVPSNKIVRGEARIGWKDRLMEQASDNFIPVARRDNIVVLRYAGGAPAEQHGLRDMS